jgi:hypothetical protein
MPIQYLVSQVEGWREEFAALPPPDPGRRKVGKHQAVIMMAKELQAAARQGYTTWELLELLAAKGLKIHVDTLREALRQARPSTRTGQVRSRRPDRVRMRTETTALSMQPMRRQPRVVLHERSALLGPAAPSARLACRSTAQLDLLSCCSGRRRRLPRAARATTQRPNFVGESRQRKPAGPREVDRERVSGSIPGLRHPSSEESFHRRRGPPTSRAFRRRCARGDERDTRPPARPFDRNRPRAPAMRPEVETEMSATERDGVVLGDWMFWIAARRSPPSHLSRPAPAGAAAWTATFDGCDR